MSSLRADLSIAVGGLNLETPVVIASGVWPYDPALWSPERLEGVGALCTKAVSLHPRCRRTLPFSGTLPEAQRRWS
ncbi:MAG: dihydroorotate dehydrogenase catalytic subunit [Synergistaceae bacterium]|nr:dihydroorotate dehydrogenase catalytic subunit [Synergistaceae bacterium]